MRKKLLFGLATTAALALSGAAWHFLQSHSTDSSQPLEEEAGFLFSAPLDPESASTRRLEVRDADDHIADEVTVFVSSPAGELTLTGKRGWVKIPVQESQPTRAAARANGSWSVLGEFSPPELREQKKQPEAILRTTTPAAHLLLEIQIEGRESAPSPWFEIHTLGTSNLAAAAELYLQIKSHGSFRFDGKDGTAALDALPPVAYQLLIGHPDCPSVTTDIRLKAGQVLRLPIVLEQGATMQVLLHDSKSASENEGQPLEGAQLALWPADQGSPSWDDPLTSFRIYGNLPAQIPATERTRSNSKGLAVFKNVPPGRYYVLAAADGFRPLVSTQAFSLTAGDTIESPSLSLLRGQNFNLKVQNEEGQKVPGASVRWQQRSPSGRPTTHINSSLPILANRAGILQLRGLPAGDLWLQVSHPDYATLEAPLPNATEVQPNSTSAPRTVTLTLFRGRKLVGQVLDSNSGIGIGAVSLKLLPQVGSAAFMSGFASRYSTEVVTHPDGTFEFQDLPPDTYLLLAHHPQYAATLSAPVAIDQSHQAPLTLTLSTGASLKVELLDEKGQARADTWVLVLHENPKSFTRAQSDAKGIARFQHLAPGTYRVMQSESVAAATSAGGRLHRDYEYVSLMDQETQRVLLGGRQVIATLEGFMLMHGQPARGRRIALLADDGAHLASSDSSGFYQFPEILPGRYLFQITGPHGPTDGSFYGSVLVRAKKVVQRDILLPSTRLSVQVVDAANNTPIPHMPVLLHPSDGTDLLGGLIQSTDDKGFAVFPTLRDGHYVLCAGDAATPFYGGEGTHAAILQEVNIDTSTTPTPSLRLRAPRGATFMVHVEDQQGRALEHVHLHYQNALGQVLNPVSFQGTNNRGDGQLRGLPAGPGFLIARHPQLGVQQIPIDLVPGQRSRQVVQLEAGITLHVQVVDKDGRPVAGVFVSAVDANGQSMSDLRNTEEQQIARLAVLRGTAQSLGPLLPGSYVLRMQRPGEEPVEQKINLSPGTQDLHLRLNY